MNRIKELRTERNMKQEDLARLLSVKRQSISRYEKEINDLDTDTIRRLCMIFGVSADYLLGWSQQRVLKLSDSDALLVTAYHAASDLDRDLVDRILGLVEERPKMKNEVS